MVGFRQSFDGIMRHWGHDIFLQRKNPSGNGFQDRLEKHTVRHMYPANRGLPQIVDEEMEGLVYNADMIYWFRTDASPREGDRIYERDNRYEGHANRAARSGQTTWLIDFALPMRGRGGRVEFWTVGVTREEPN